MESRVPSDVELVCLARTGEAAALAGLLERYRPSLYAAAVGALHNRDDAHDAVQDTLLVALARLDALRDPAAVGGWLHQILRNTCLMFLRRAARTVSTDVPGQPVPSAETVVEGLALRDWVWAAVDALAPDDRVTVMLRYFTRCDSYEAIAAVTGVPIGTVRSRLHRSRALLGDRLRHTVDAAAPHAARTRQQVAEWQGFYDELHEAPVPRTYRDRYASDVEVADGVGGWCGIDEWSAHEREAIILGVRADIVGVVAGVDVTVLEIDFVNPTWASDHCPPRSTFVHRLSAERSRRLDIHYV